MPPPDHRQRLWQSLPLGPIARVGAFQLLAGLLLLPQTEPGSGSRAAVCMSVCTGVLTLPLGRLIAHLSRDRPRAYWWSGRVWAAMLPAFFAKTLAGAFDGSGLKFAERATAPFVLAAVVGLGFCIGAQGALLAVPKEVGINVAATMIGMACIKLQVAYTHAYLLLHVAAFGALLLGYACVAKYADLQETLREAAEAVVVGAAAREGFVVTDVGLHVLAVNRRLLDVLGYEEHELVGQPVMVLVSEGTELADDHAWVRRTLFEAASRKQSPNGHVWSVRAKNGQTHPVRITLGEARCPINGTKMFTAQFTCMRLEQRNAQLISEKERLQWEVASHHDGEEDPRELLGATVPEKLECHECAPDGCDVDGCPLFDKTPHRTLGEMQDQALTDAAVSCANSFDHVNSNASPTLPGHALVAPVPPKSTDGSLVSLGSSVMDTVSQAAKKNPTRAPPPPKQASRLPRLKTTRSEPSASKPKAGNSKKPKRAVPPVERIGPDPREDC